MGVSGRDDGSYGHFGRADEKDAGIEFWLYKLPLELELSIPIEHCADTRITFGVTNYVSYLHIAVIVALGHF